MKRRGSRIFFAALLCLLILASSQVVMAAKTVTTAETKKTPLTGGDLSVTVNECLGGNAKDGRICGVEINITNNGEDFSGTVNVMQQIYDGKTAEEVEVLIAAGETKTVVLPVTAADRTTLITLVISEDGNKKVLEAPINLALTMTTNALIGVFSEDATNISYFSNAFATLVPMDESNFPAEAEVLNSYDLIIINNYDASKLSSQQYDTLKTWVQKGGTLVIGTGENAAKTLGIFQDDFIAGTYKTTNSITTSFGLSVDALKSISQFEYKDIGGPGNFNTVASGVRNAEILSEEELLTPKEEGQTEEEEIVPSVQKECLDLVVADAQVCLQEGNQPILYRKEEGKGAIEVWGIDLGLDNTTWSTLGNQLQKVIYSCMGTFRKQSMLQLLDGYYGGGNMSSLSDGDITSIPKTSRFFVLILIYLIIVGPVLYLVLKRFEKRDYLWGAIPLVAILFTILITMVGSGNKYRSASASYLEYVYLSDSNTVVDSVQLVITTPKSNDYLVELKNGYQGEWSANYSYGYYWSGDNTYASSVTGNRSGEKEQFYIDSATAFGKYSFGAERIKTQERPYESSLAYDSANKLTGSFTNRSGLNLTNSAILTSDTIYVLGKVGQGESVEVSNAAKSSHYGDIYWNTGMEQLIGSTYDESNRTQRLQYEAVSNLYNNYIGNTQNEVEFLIGFAEEDAEDTFADSIGMDASGVTLVVLPINTVKTTENNTAASGNINDFLCAATSTVYDEQNGDYTNDQKELICKYQLPANTTDVHLSIDFYSKNGFEVCETVYAYNFNMKSYVEVLKLNTLSCDLGADYINEDQQMVLKYTSPSAYSNETYSLPEIVMEGGQN